MTETGGKARVPVGGHLALKHPPRRRAEVRWTGQRGPQILFGDLSLLLFMLLNPFPKQIEDT